MRTLEQMESNARRRADLNEQIKRGNRGQEGEWK